MVTIAEIDSGSVLFLPDPAENAPRIFEGAECLRKYLGKDSALEIPVSSRLVLLPVGKDVPAGRMSVQVE